MRILPPRQKDLEDSADLNLLPEPLEDEGWADLLGLSFDLLFSGEDVDSGQVVTPIFLTACGTARFFGRQP